MSTKHVRLLCLLLLTLPTTFTVTLRPQIENNLRGQSFGLENFLFQTYEGSEVNTPIRDVKPKRVRPTVGYRTSSPDRGQTFGLENLSAQVYESNRLKPTPVKLNSEYLKRRPTEPVVDLNRLKATYGTKTYEPTTEIAVEVETTQSDVLPEDVNTDRIRKRIVMRRRKKRPNNGTQQEDNGDVGANTIVKPVRIPVFPQASRPTVRARLPNVDTTQRSIPVTGKSIRTTTTQPEIAYTEAVTLQARVKTEILEKSTAKDMPTTEKPATLNLKDFLKQQTETLSLSELLQTQNLSLADLLRGNKDASAILKAKPSPPSPSPPSPLPPIPTANAGLKRKTFNRPDTTTTTTEVIEQDPPKKMEVLEVTTSRPSYNKFHPKIPRIKPAAQVDPKPIDKQPTGTEDNPEEVSSTTKRTTPYNLANFDPQSRINELRSKLRNFQRKTNSGVVQSEVTRLVPAKEETIEPAWSTTSPKPSEEPLYKKNRISYKSSNNPDISLILPTKVKFPELTDKRPDRITNWTNRLPSLKRFGQERIKPSDNLVTRPLKVPISTDENDTHQDPQQDSFDDAENKTVPKPSEEGSFQDVRKPHHKDELVELLKSGQNADRLEKILLSRNMTIQELLDNREKPPLQMNITEIFSNSPKPERPSTSPPLIFDSLPNFDLDPKRFKPSETIDYQEPYAEESVPSVAKVELAVSRVPKRFDLAVPDPRGNSDLNLQPDDLQTDTSNSENSALWKLSEKSIYYGNSYDYEEVVTPKVEETQPPKTFNIKEGDLTESDIILFETIRRNQDSKRKFKLDISEFMREEEEPEAEDIEKSYIPPAVKSAIIASGVVMGIALFVFIAIFATCGWKQRQIRLKASSSILTETLTKNGDKSKRPNSLSPVSFKETSSYKKTLDFDEETSESGTSNTSSYLWSTLKNTFTSRTSTLKSRLEKEEKMREEKATLRRNESRRNVESRLDERGTGFQEQEDRFAVKKIDRDRNVINTSFNFKRSSSNNNVNHFNDCTHGY